MTQDEIIEMAVQAKLYSGNPRTPSTGRMIEKRLEAFAKLIAAKERDDIWEMACDYTQRYNSHVCLALADEIRARGEA